MKTWTKVGVVCFMFGALMVGVGMGEVPWLVAAGAVVSLAGLIAMGER